MNTATFVYKKYLSTSGRMRNFWKFLRRKLIIFLNDPDCIFDIHGQQLQMPLSHSLPGILASYSFYDSLPGRLSEFFRQEKGNFSCIDVGANIGDTIASFMKNEKDIFLAIEPNPNFYKFLVANWGQSKNVRTVNVLCSSEVSSGKCDIQEQKGTASIVEDESGILMDKKPLDIIVKAFPEFTSVDIIKIDTDGHDFDVIAGSKNTISQNKPAVLFECDAFENENYVKTCLNTLNFFKESGYKHFLVYDNFGYLLGKYSLHDLTPFKNLLFYQLTSKFYYFDILLMEDIHISRFHENEVSFFVNHMKQDSLKKTARLAAVT